MSRLCVLVLAGLAARTAAANPYLDQGRKLYEALQFQDALQQLEVAKDVPTNDLREKVEILDLLARCQIAEGRRAEAVEAYQELLTLAPYTELPRDLSPKILEAFDAARSALFEPGYVAFKILPSPPGVIRAELVDPWHQVDQVIWGRRPAGVTRWKESTVAPEEHVVSFPVESEHEDWLAWYAEARRKDGTAAARLGSPEEPRVYSTLPPDAVPGKAAKVSEPIRVRRGVAIGIAAAAVIAAGVASYLEVASRSDSQGAHGEPWADTASRLQARAQSEARWGAGLFVGAGAGAAAGGVLFAW